MPVPLAAPAASVGAEGHADWLELLALKQGDASLEDFVSAVRAVGSLDALVDDQGDPEEDLAQSVDSGSVLAQILAEDALGEAESRSLACGGSRHYPFELVSTRLVRRRNADQTTYAFLLLLSKYGLRAGPPASHPERLFEELSVVAARNYFGGAASGARSSHFGFPRRVAPRNFKTALDDLCRAMGEGGGTKDVPQSKTALDAKLDVVCWIPMPDGQVGKLMGFGQCATGGNWEDKLYELQIPAWCEKWMQETVVVKPVRMFFLPHRIPAANWNNASIDAGIIFDRCRLAAFASQLDRDLRDKIRAWSRHVIEQELGA